MSWKSKSWFVCILLLLLGLSTISAQENGPNYVVNIIAGRISTDGSTLEVEFGVTNNGGPANVTTRVELAVFDEEQPRVVDSAALRPLGGNSDREILVLGVPVDTFEPGSRQVFLIQIVTPDGQQTITSASQELIITIPQTTAPSGADDAAATSVSEGDASTVTSVEDLLDQLGLRTLSREQLALFIAIGGAILIVLWLGWLMLRLLFRRPSIFKSWQPPYSMVPPIDPYSTAGIRQSWQQFAQNNAIMVPCNPGTSHARKRLLGRDGDYLVNWRITAARISQYDQYGRVTRSQVIVPGRIMRRLNRMARNRMSLTPKQIEGRSRAISKRLVTRLFQNISRTSAPLPIALDIRFEGTHGEVNILFELFQCQNGLWQMIDQWQPDMMVMTKAIRESYTFTIYGQTGNERYRDFRKRCITDLTRVLVALYEVQQPQEQPQAESEVPVTSTVEAGEADTSPGIAPVEADT